jgi:hypothetical protein
MGLELNSGTLYMIEPDGGQVKLGDNVFGDIEIDTCSPNEIPDMYYTLRNAVNASFSCEMTLAGLDCLSYKPFVPAEKFNIEHNVEILVQARWHKKKRINKKWLKRYGMKVDTVRMKATARTLSYDTETGECEFEVDKLELCLKTGSEKKIFKN